MDSGIRRLADNERVQARSHLDKMADLIDRDLVLTSYSLHQGRFGQGYRLQLADPETGEEYQVITTGVVICAKIDILDPDTDLPTLVRFVRHERYYDIE